MWREWPYPARGVATPPVIASLTPVVPGKVIASPRTLRTARYAKASASIASADQPRSPAVQTAQGSRRNSRIKVGLCAPPPQTISIAGCEGNRRSAAEIAGRNGAVLESLVDRDGRVEIIVRVGQRRAVAAAALDVVG